MGTTQRNFHLGPYTLSPTDSSEAAVPFFLAGRKMYAVGRLDNAIEPIGAEHLVGEMGGVWVHPIKVADGLMLRIMDAHGTPLPAQHTEVIEALSHIEWHYTMDGLDVLRRDLIAEDHAAFVSLLELHNTSDTTLCGTLQLQVWLKFLGCWFGGLAAGGGEYWLDGALVLGYDRLWQGRWGVACGMLDAPTRCTFAAQPNGHLATLEYPFTLLPGATQVSEFLLTADHQRGHEGARHLFGQLAGSGGRLLHDKQAQYYATVFHGVALNTPDPAVNRSFALAKANLRLLSADYGPHLAPYFLAGVPEYPQLFGCDTEYTVPGATAAGFRDVVKSALLTLADYGQRACGRIPHEITTNGRVFHPGNTQETPQFAAACWDYFRWTGDMPFLQRVYPLCKEGVDAYMPALWSGFGSPYPIGDGVVERGGMGPRKLDSTCYLYQALEALANMAAALDALEDADRYTAQRVALLERFEQDWWLEDEGMYADSLSFDGVPQLDGHWTVVLPLQLGMARPDRAARSLERIRREWVNEWGLVHTRAREELVWTLPTGLLALAAFRCGQSDFGAQLLQHIAETANHGTLGAFKELIPIGLCFVQLWSAGLYAQGIIEGLLGIQPLAHRHQVAIDPQWPTGWPDVRLQALPVGAHEVTLHVRPTRLELHHLSGPERLAMRYRLPETHGPLHHNVAFGPAPELVAVDQTTWVQAALLPGQRIVIDVSSDATRVIIPDRRDAAPHA